MRNTRSVKKIWCFILATILLISILATPEITLAEGTEVIESEDTITSKSDYQEFLLDENLSSEEYQLKKQEFLNEIVSDINLKSRELTSNNNALSNEFIEAVVNQSNGRFSIGTTGGNPDLSSDDGKILLYGHPNPGTSYTTVNIDGNIYIWRYRIFYRTIL